jgi:hypothetical protein
MMVLLLASADGERCLRQEAVSELARLGVTNLTLVRDGQTVGVVLEGWLFDPASSAAAAAELVAGGSRTQSLYPLMNVAVSAAQNQGGPNGREPHAARA